MGVRTLNLEELPVVSFDLSSSVFFSPLSESLIGKHRLLTKLEVQGLAE